MKRKLLRILIILIAILAVLFIAVLIFLYGCTTHKKAPNNTASVHNGLYVDGTKLKAADGTPIVLRGINHAHCWYKDYDEVALQAIADTGANCIRIVCADGDQWTRDSGVDLRRLVDRAWELGMISVLEVHDGTGKDSMSYLDHIAEFWVEVAPELMGTENYCIINIANEWVGGWNANLWLKGYKKVIPMLREAGIRHVFMVDAAGWGQYGRSIRKNGLKVFQADPDANTMFSVHMYGMSGRYKWLIRYNLEGATDQNLCVCVGEFGYTHEDGNVLEDYLMEYCRRHEIGTIAWS